MKRGEDVIEVPLREWRDTDRKEGYSWVRWEEEEEWEWKETT